MTTFYDSYGAPVAYMEDDTSIYLFSGEPVAYLESDSVYSFSGKHLGRFENGWIRDNYGDCVFFTDNASGGLIKPMKEMKPMKSMKCMKPMKSMREMRPMKPMNSLSWSNFSGKTFFNQ